ncbi:hypothetical protein [Vogesella indigofera]|uniref:hypothetical protein n=1 Tax=Vogesella indigofera TaxID=45465 RepID=UPI00234CB522|nr:hypothetical protein [Vogesella indigofera]MDC7704051.1 hypothetical protein [Vogesella indigofera]
MPPTMNTPRLPIDTCEKLFDKLKWDHSQLEKDWGSSYCAFNFIVTAYHLYNDWISVAGTKEQRKRRHNLPSHGKLLFVVWRDITNATKHWELDEKSQKKQVVSEVSGPIVGDWYSYFIAGPVHYVRVGNTLPSLPELAHVTIRCFQWLLEGEQSVKLSDLDRQLAVVFQTIMPKPT